MLRKATIAAAVCAVALVGGTASAAFAGEVTGNGKPAQGSANAVKKIERDGYKNVQGMTRNPDGSWSGKALRGGAMVDVQVDARGNVITR